MARAPRPRRGPGSRAADTARTPTNDDSHAAADPALARGTEDMYRDPTLYDFEFRDRTRDVRWYRRFARDVADRSDPTGPILELGAGSGRVTLPLARDGHHVIALDRMAPMLERLSERLADARTPSGPLQGRVRVLQGDMTRIPLRPSSVAAVIAPFNALMHLYTWRDLLACFRQVRRVLRPGGAFAFDVELPDLDWLTWDRDVRHSVGKFRHPRTGETMVYSTNHTYDPQTQICHIRIYYDHVPPGRRGFDPHAPPAEPAAVFHLAHRQIFPEEVRALTELAGLELCGLDGDFRGRPLAPGVQSMVAVCRRPA